MNIDEIQKLSNDELKDEIIKINQRQLKNIKKSSLLNILISLKASKDIVKNNDILKDDKIETELKMIFEIIEQMELLVVNEDIDRTYEIRDKLIKKKNILNGYMVEISYMGELVDEYGVRILSNNKEYKYFKGPNVKELITLIENTLDDSKENYGKYIFIISEIINVLPMNMVKRNYYDILEATIKRNLKNYNKSAVDMTIDNYKKQFDSSIRDGYGMTFDYYFMEIQKIKRKDLSKLDLDELSELVETIIDLTKELTILRDLVLSLGIINNLLIVINKSDEIDIEKDKIINQWLEVLNDEEELERFDKNLRKEVRKIDNLVQSELSLYEALTIELSKRDDFDHSLLEDELLKTRSILIFYNDIRFSELESLESMDINIVEPEYLSLSIESLVDYIERSMVGMSNMERKIRMRKLLSIMELPFENIQKFTDYIEYCFNERVLDKRIINFKINQIVYFLNEVSDK